MSDPSSRLFSRRPLVALATNALLAFLVLLALAAPVADASRSRAVGAVEIAAHGGFFVGGQAVSLAGLQPRARVSADPAHAPPLDLNGQYWKGATYVEYTTLARPRVEVPIVMVPGGGLSAASYQDTPDGRPGWEAYFLRRGYSVDIVDADRTGRSPWRAFPEIDFQEPSFRNHAFLWETFRLGPPGSYAGRRAYPDTRFPIASFDAFASQVAPRFRSDPREQALTFDLLLRRLCPCILMLHSASGAPGMAAAQRLPGLVRAVVAVEPSGAPSIAGAVRAIPHVFVWGDHLAANETSPSWSQEHSQALDYSARLRSAGARVEWIELPHRGIHGNSHLLMMDRNSDEVAGLIDAALGRLLDPARRQRR